jgi:hypothetical protein
MDKAQLSDLVDFETLDAEGRERLQNWMDAMQAVNALSQMDGLLPELQAAVIFEEKSCQAFNDYIHANSLNRTDSQTENTPKAPRLPAEAVQLPVGGRIDQNLYSTPLAIQGQSVKG